MPLLRPGIRRQICRSECTCHGGDPMTITAVPTSARRHEELAELAARAGVELEGQPAEAIVAWAVETFGERFCVTSSFADAVLVHVVSRVAPGIEVVFLDTGLHFAETLRVRDIVQRTLPVTVRSIRPRLTVAEQEAA